MKRRELVFCEDCPDRSACDTELYRCDVVKLVHESCTAQGIPVKVTSPTVLHKVAVLLKTGGRPRRR